MFKQVRPPSPPPSISAIRIQVEASVFDSSLSDQEYLIKSLFDLEYTGTCAKIGKKDSKLSTRQEPQLDQLSICQVISLGHWIETY